MFCQLRCELKLTPYRTLQLALLRALCALLRHCALSDSLLCSRAARAIVPSLTTLLSTQADVQKEEDNAQAGATKSKKGKKRARGYEGDEVFKISRQMVCLTEVAGEVVLTSLEGWFHCIVSYPSLMSHLPAVHLLLSRASLSASIQSVAARVLIAVYIGISNIPPNLFSPDPALHSNVYELVQRICVELGAGTSSTLSKSLGLLVNASFHGHASSVRVTERLCAS